MSFSEKELFETSDMTKSSPDIPTMSQNTFSIVLPYYNEAGFLENTLLSWLNQKRKPDQIILVDNGSTDGSETLAQRVLKDIDCIEVIFLHESRPGKIYALETGCKAVTCEFIAMSDADTIYPPHYLELCEKLFADSSDKISVLMALPEFDRPQAIGSRLRRRYFIGLSRVFKKHTFTGGYGHIFRTQALRQAGSFSVNFWPHVLLDHEIMYRIFKQGLSRYHIELWCQSSQRRQDRRQVRWNLLERILYQITPYPLQNWFFYRFLGPRFEKRKLNQLNLRKKTWL